MSLSVAGLARQFDLKFRARPNGAFGKRDAIMSESHPMGSDTSTYVRR